MMVMMMMMTTMMVMMVKTMMMMMMIVRIYDRSALKCIVEINDGKKLVTAD